MADASPPTHGDGTGEMPTPVESRLEMAVREGREAGAFERLEAAYLGRDAFVLLARLYRERATAAPLLPWRLELLARLAELLESELGDEAGAAEVYGEMARLGDEPALEEQLRLLRARSDRTGTWRALDLAVERARDKATRCHALTRRGWAALEAGEESAARADFAAALSQVPGDLDALTGVVRLLRPEEDPAPLRALALAVEQLPEGPDRHERWRQLGRLADARPDFAALSTSAWQAVAAAQPEDAEAAERLTSLLAGSGQEEALVGVLRGRLQRVPRGDGARGLRRQLVAALERLGREEEALEALRDAVRAEPGHHEAWLWLADRAEVGGRHAEFAWALEHAATSTVEPARRAQLWRRLGGFLGRVPGKAEDARACIERAVRLERALESGSHAMGPLTRVPRPRGLAAETAESPPPARPGAAVRAPGWPVAPLTSEPTPMPGSSSHSAGPAHASRPQWDDEVPLVATVASPADPSTDVRAPVSVPPPALSPSEPALPPMELSPRRRDTAVETAPRWGERPPVESPTWGAAPPPPDVTPVGPPPEGDASGPSAAALSLLDVTPVGPQPARAVRPPSITSERTRILAPPPPSEAPPRGRGSRPPSPSEGQTRILAGAPEEPAAARANAQGATGLDVTPVGPPPRGNRPAGSPVEPTRILAPVPVDSPSRPGERPPEGSPTWTGGTRASAEADAAPPSVPERAALPALTPQWGGKVHQAPVLAGPDVTPVGPAPPGVGPDTARTPALPLEPNVTPPWGGRLPSAPGPLPVDLTPVGLDRTTTDGVDVVGAGRVATEPGLELLPGPILAPDTWRSFAEAVAAAGDGWLASLAREAAQVLSGMAPESSPAPRWVLGAAMRKNLQHPELDGELAELLALAAPALVACSEQSAISGVGAPFRVNAGPGAGEALEALAWSVRILGLPSPRPELSSQPGPPFSLVASTGESVRLLVGSLAVRQPLPSGELRFFAGRALYTRQPLLRVLRLVPTDELEDLLGALPGAVRGGGRLGHDERELRAQLPEAVREQLLPRLGCLEEELNLDALAMASRHAANRAGLAACGSVGAAVQALRAKRGLEEELEELLRFALSPAWRAISAGSVRNGVSAAGG